MTEMQTRCFISSTARLAILPGLTHYNVFSSPALASTVAPFLDAPMPGTR
jgi:hypothetical protein